MDGMNTIAMAEVSASLVELLKGYDFDIDIWEYMKDGFASVVVFCQVFQVEAIEELEPCILFHCMILKSRTF